MKNKLLIAIPSKGRAETIGNQTYRFAQHSSFDVKVFVEPQDYQSYYNVIKPNHLFCINANDLGLGYCKNFIKKYAVDNGYKYIFKFDDDLRTLRNADFMNLGRIPIDPVERCKKVLDEACKDAIELFEAEEAVGGISLVYDRFFYSQNNHREPWIGTNKRFESNYIVRTEFFGHEKVYEDFKGIYEDFYTFFRILENGSITVTYGKAGFDVYWVGLNKGGHQSFDRRKLSLEAKKYLEKRFPWLQWKKVTGKNWDFEPDLIKTKKLTNNYTNLYV